jgi:hypothetical protein
VRGSEIYTSCRRNGPWRLDENVAVKAKMWYLPFTNIEVDEVNDRWTQ